MATRSVGDEKPSENGHRGPPSGVCIIAENALDRATGFARLLFTLRSMQMFWVSKVFAPLALVAGIAATTATFASADGNQPPFGKGGFGQPGKGGFGKGDKKDDKKTDKKAEKKTEKKDEKKSAAPAKADPQVEAWLAILLTKITDPHDTVRDSARGAIVAVGPPALPALQKLADGDDSAKAVAAKKMIQAIHVHHGNPGGERGFGPPAKGGERGPGGERGFGGFGFGERGFGPGGFGGKDGERGERGGPPGKGPGRPGGREEEENEVRSRPDAPQHRDPLTQSLTYSRSGAVF